MDHSSAEGVLNWDHIRTTGERDSSAAGGRLPNLNAVEEGCWVADKPPNLNVVGEGS